MQQAPAGEAAYGAAAPVMALQAVLNGSAGSLLPGLVQGGAGAPGVRFAAPGASPAPPPSTPRASSGSTPTWAVAVISTLAASALVMVVIPVAVLVFRQALLLRRRRRQHWPPPPDAPPPGRLARLSHGMLGRWTPRAGAGLQAEAEVEGSEASLSDSELGRAGSSPRPVKLPVVAVNPDCSVLVAVKEEAGHGAESAPEERAGPSAPCQAGSAQHGGGSGGASSSAAPMPAPRDTTLAGRPSAAAAGGASAWAAGVGGAGAAPGGDWGVPWWAHRGQPPPLPASLLGGSAAAARGPEAAPVFQYVELLRFGGSMGGASRVGFQRVLAPPPAGAGPTGGSAAVQGARVQVERVAGPLQAAVEARLTRAARRELLDQRHRARRVPLVSVSVAVEAGSGGEACGGREEEAPATPPVRDAPGRSG
eukprot:scaffold2.g7048.t1